MMSLLLQLWQAKADCTIWGLRDGTSQNYELSLIEVAGLRDETTAFDKVSGKQSGDGYQSLTRGINLRHRLNKCLIVKLRPLL